MKNRLEEIGKLLSNLKPRATIIKCWHSLQSECKGKIKQAHALQNNRILSKIAVNGMIQTLEGRSNVFFQDSKLKGKAMATTFFGFCDYHDTTLFREIEDKDYCESDIQNFLFAYRTFIWHRHKKIESISSQTNAVSSLMEITGIHPNEEVLEIFDSFELSEKDGEFYQSIFNEMLISQKYDRLRSNVWKLGYEVSFAVSASLEPMFDLLGKQLYHINDERLPKVYLNIFPTNGETFCIWSWLDCDDKYYKNYVEQFFSLSDRNKKNYLNNNLTLHSDGIFFSPKLWDSFGKEIQESLIAHSNFDTLILGMELEEGCEKFRYIKTPWDFFVNLF